MLFNIGGEGQAMIGGLGVGLVVLMLDAVLPPVVVLLLAVPAAAAFGAVWGDYSGLASGQTRQPYCDHNDYV